jgi:gluconolactonase
MSSKASALNRAVACALLAFATLGPAHAQAPADPPERPFGIVRMDPALDAVIAPDAKLELIAEGFGLTEGGVWLPASHPQGPGLLFSDLTANVIYKWAPDGVVSVFLDKAGYTGNDINNAGTQTQRSRMAVIMIGPNGTALDPQGRLVWCAPPDGMIMRLEKDGTRTVLAARYNGKRFNGPNDVVVRSDGAIYFTDSDFGLRGSFRSPQKELDFNGVYLVKDGQVTLLVDNKGLGGFPNGIAFSPDEKYLYLSSGFTKMMRYEVKPDGTLGAGTVFFEGGEGIVDGMATDNEGNLYSTGGAGPGAVRISSPDGKHLGTLHLPISHKEPRQPICATNVAFGDADGKSLFITACAAVYRIRVKVPGLRGPSAGQ